MKVFKELLLHNKDKIPNEIKRKLVNSCVILTLSYISETWATIEKDIEKLAIAQ